MAAEPTPSPAVEPAEPESPPSRSRRRASAGSSRGSSAAAEPFFADPGGGFDAEAAAEEAEPVAADEPLEVVLWDEARIRRVLELQGRLTHAVVGVAESDWLWLPSELDMVCGPLAEHCNRVPALAALAHLSDDAAIAAGFVSYAVRSWIERTRALQARQADNQPRPVTGRAPEPTPAPEDVSWTTPTP